MPIWICVDCNAVAKYIAADRVRDNGIAFGLLAALDALGACSCKDFSQSSLPYRLQRGSRRD